MLTPHSTNSSFQKIWKQLEDHNREIANSNLCNLFEKDWERSSKFSIELNDIYIDYSKQYINTDSLNLLLSLAEAADTSDAIDRLFTGQVVNTSEHRPALHTALRASVETPVLLNGENISALVENELQRLGMFVEKLRTGEINGHSGKSINTLINIGIGGSDLGPRMVVNALKPFSTSQLTINFVANIDTSEINEVISQSDPESTLFCISSKSFTTSETLANAELARSWLSAHGCKDTAKHFIAVSASHEAAKSWGIDPENIFSIWDWVGGRYSLWSAIGLPIAASIGMNQFQQLLAGARKMDEHFQTSPLGTNIPVILAMLDIWNINFFNMESLAIVPYDESLKLLPDYLSQLMMESNGKNITKDGDFIDYQTAPIIWGGVGTNVQHAFFQLLHQGTRRVPVEFLASIQGDEIHQENHSQLLANCVAQGETLLKGSVNSGKKKPFTNIKGNKPSTIILYKELNPETLGSLLALYEHRTFIQGHIWNINSFDQWGVELGKKLASIINDEFNGIKTEAVHDSSTQHLIERYLNRENIQK